MASIIPDFEYDIFLSYRQNDNRGVGDGEGWVTEFVSHLKGELDSVLKDRLSIYFDKNPHDGLSDVHDVDKSLKFKVKSLIFIPIISQTYCDDKSFAWNYEFLAFLDHIAKDKYGPIVKLPNGNIQHRVLPVRIHEIDQKDQDILESVLNSKLRSIDFIYKHHGVNRPLLSKEENPAKNLNHLLYRDQVNKVANSIKDLISGLQQFDLPAAISKSNKIPISLDPDLNYPGGSTNTIAVLPFDSESKKYDYLAESLPEELIRILSQFKGLRVLTRTISFGFGKKKIDLESLKLHGATSCLRGNISGSADKFVIELELISTKDLSVKWKNRFEAQGDLFNVISSTSSGILDSLMVKVSDHEKQLLKKEPSRENEAYLLYLNGQYLWHQQGNNLVEALSHFQKAVEMDPKFALAHAGVANTYLLLGYYNLMSFSDAFHQAKKSCLQALQLNVTLSPAYDALAMIGMCYEWSWPEMEPYFARVFALNPANQSAQSKFKFLFERINSVLAELEDEPVLSVPFFLPAYAFIHHGNFDAALEASKTAIEKDSNSYMAHRAMGLSYLGLDKYDKAIESLEQAASLSNRHQSLLFELMGAYMLSGRLEEANAILDETMMESNKVTARINNFFFQSR